MTGRSSDTSNSDIEDLLIDTPSDGVCNVGSPSELNMPLDSADSGRTLAKN